MKEYIDVLCDRKIPNKIKIAYNRIMVSSHMAKNVKLLVWKLMLRL